MYEVADFSFEDLPISINKIYCSSWSGTAGVDSDGRVCSLILDGQYEGNKAHARLDVPNIYKHNKTWPEKIACVLASELEHQYKDKIRETLDDWVDSLDTREFEAAK